MHMCEMRGETADVRTVLYTHTPPLTCSNICCSIFDSELSEIRASIYGYLIDLQTN